jgi:Membrane bound FAD containing D-sorbitol dehydrogenase
MSAAASLRRPAREQDQEEVMTGFTRRKMLTGAAATAVGAVGSANLTTQTAAQTTAADDADRALFIALSAALTGIAKERLSPAVDPVQINREYFKQAKTDPAFDGLMQIIRADPSDPDAAAGKVLFNSDSNIVYLGRSIILMWYLGAWYEPKKLKDFNSSPPRPPYSPDKIISPAAYTQGWTWRVAQAHPMGYSELLFGYWSKKPPALDGFIG